MQAIHPRSHRLPALLSAALVVASLLGSGAIPVAAQTPTRTLVVSTDLGADDLLAIAWLVNDPALEVPAILVTGTGLADCTTGVDDLRALLATLDAEGPEIGCGATTPLGGGTPFPADERAAAAGLYGLGLPPAADAGSSWRPAEEILGGILDEAYDPVTILSMGPMTTLGSVLTDPDRAVKVASVTASLGALDGPGNVIPEGATTPGPAEWNAHADPAGAEAVVAGGAPLTIVPLEAAAGAPLSATLADALLAGGDVPTAAFVARLVAARPDLVGAGAVAPDAIAAVALTHPEILTTRERSLDVSQVGPDAGALTEDEENGFPLQVTTAVDRTGFEAALLSGVRAEGGTVAESPAGTLVISGGATACDLNTGGTTGPGLAIVEARSTDEPLVAVLAGLAEGYGISDLEASLATASPTDDPPDWLLLAAYLEVDAGSSSEDSAELTPGDYAAICITGDASTPHYLVAQTLLTVSE